MKKILCCLTVLLGLTWASAQASSSSSGSQASGSSPQTSSPDQGTKADQGTKKGTKKGGGETTLTGCLSGPNSEGAYELQRGSKKVEVGGNDELSKHVGHTVRLHGSWAKSGSEVGEKEEASEKGEAKGGAEAKGGKEEKGERHFKVTAIDHISESCKGGAAAGGAQGGHKHKKGEGAEGGGAAQPSPSPSPKP